MSIIQLYTQDVFGRDSQDGVHFEGLVDCSSEEDFLSQLRRLKPIWDKRDLQFSAEAHFYEWLRKFKMEDFIKGTLREIQEKAGLGCPPKAYYTNSNEAINRILKEAVQWKKSPLPEFINKMKAMVDQQKSEMEKAIISTGEYSLKPQFDGLKVEQSLFYRMNEKQRLHCFKRFHTSTLDEANHIQDIGTTSSSKGKGKAKANSLGSLIPTFEQVATLLLLPSESLKGIWMKAFDLCNNPKAIVPMPGGGDKDCFVLPKSSMLPHAVTIKGLLYQCDAQCIHFGSLAVCSHTVAAAHRNADLTSFMNALAAKKVQPNLFQLSKHGMPRGAGKKGNILPRRKRKPTTVLVNDDSFLNGCVPPKKMLIKQGHWTTRGHRITRGH